MATLYQDVNSSVAYSYAMPIDITGVTATDRIYNSTTTIELAGGVLNGVLGGDAYSQRHSAFKPAKKHKS